MIVQFRNEKVSNHGCIYRSPLTEKFFSVVAVFIVLKINLLKRIPMKPAHKASNSTSPYSPLSVPVSFSGCNGVTVFARRRTCG
ncbi:hypothetical protein TNCV_3076891 [Trichonephila clavipes]|nr:hypothetical protein TNCV_3076891 [Trichonephila clavipes]